MVGDAVKSGRKIHFLPPTGENKMMLGLALFSGEPCEMKSKASENSIRAVVAEVYKGAV
ncbi:MAG: hypothetical protein R2744_09870 [Bacteroidales bacterium]